ncbi:MAG TPA: DUF4446 family protein [Candidatus Binatia bacterium]|nr:DUF4446 family protein [Candidatus Binatia bacterium]
MQILTLYAVGGALVGAIAAVVIYHLAVVRPALGRVYRLLALHDELVGGGKGGAAGRLAGLETRAAESHAELDRLRNRITELERLSSTDLSRAGFVRYDAFAGSGNGLSYALALLNRQGDGVVITSIYSREDTRTYGKPVAAFKPTVQASGEELEAIERARSNGAARQ